MKSVTINNQRGITMIMSLILLFVTTIAAIAAGRGSGLQYIMAGNSAQSQIAYYAAEAGIEQGEAWIDSNISSSGQRRALVNVSNNGVFQQGDEPFDLSDLKLWFGRNDTKSANNAIVRGQARFMIRWLGEIAPLDPNYTGKRLNAFDVIAVGENDDGSVQTQIISTVYRYL